MREFFRPRGIAVIGASENPDAAGTRVLSHLDRFGFAGDVHPVSRRHQELGGLKCYPRVEDVPDPVDLAVIAVGAAATPEAVRECGRRGIPAAVLFAAGFGGDTVQGRQLQHQLEEAQRESSIRVIGPNTVGIRLVQSGLFATFAHDVEGGVLPGNIAVVAQSGGLGVYFGSAYLKRRLVGTRYLVDTGSELDVTAAEVIEYVADDPDVSCVGVLLEGAKDGRRLIRAVELARTRGKPVVCFRVGRSRAAVRQVASHTGAISSDALLFDTALTDAGARVVHDEEAFMDALAIHEMGNAPQGRRLGVVTPSGGYGVLTIDAADAYRMELPEPQSMPSTEAQEALSSGNLGNPFDWASRGPARGRTRPMALQWMLAQPNVDAVLLWEAYSMEMPERAEQILDALRTATAGERRPPLFVCGIAPAHVEEELHRLGIMLLPEPTRLVRALSLVAPAAAPTITVHPPAEGRSAGSVLGAEARALLDCVSHVPSSPVADAGAATTLAQTWGRLFLKVESAEHPHKSESHLVEGPLTPADAAAAYQRLEAARAAVGLDATAPIVAQPALAGVELALGAFIDPTFGPAVTVASGGIFVEILRDAVSAPAPVTEQRARDMLGRLRGWPLLAGARGRPPADVDAAAQAIVALSRFIAEADGAYQAIDVNPLIVAPAGEGAYAVDSVLFPATARAAVSHQEVPVP